MDGRVINLDAGDGANWIKRARENKGAQRVRLFYNGTPPTHKRLEYVEVGLCDTYEDAQEAADQLRLAGTPARVTSGPRGTHRVWARKDAV